MRIGNLEFKYSSFNRTYEIVKWFKNKFFYEKHLYTEVSEGKYRKVNYPDFTFVDKSCFEHPETCYVVAFLDVVDNKVKVRYIDNRQWCVNPIIFYYLLFYGKRQIRKELQ